MAGTHPRPKRPPHRLTPGRPPVRSAHPAARPRGRRVGRAVAPFTPRSRGITLDRTKVGSWPAAASLRPRRRAGAPAPRRGRSGCPRGASRRGARRRAPRLSGSGPRRSRRTAAHRPQHPRAGAALSLDGRSTPPDCSDSNPLRQFLTLGCQRPRRPSMTPRNVSSRVQTSTSYTLRLTFSDERRHSSTMVRSPISKTPSPRERSRP